ncbi:MAG: hypothetical protein M3O15_04270 [Acidobacteriota bacterium]|nr:hypothetical protein [Acidobacteriota bacterium]
MSNGLAGPWVVQSSNNSNYGVGTAILIALNSSGTFDLSDRTGLWTIANVPSTNSGVLDGNGQGSDRRTYRVHVVLSAGISPARTSGSFSVVPDLTGGALVGVWGADAPPAPAETMDESEAAADLPGRIADGERSMRERPQPSM